MGVLRWRIARHPGSHCGQPRGTGSKVRQEDRQPLQENQGRQIPSIHAHVCQQAPLVARVQLAPACLEKEHFGRGG